ncbi:MAG: flagellar basal-body MS-ring/collar protein FliF [Sporolactobacillus sp.]
MKERLLTWVRRLKKFWQDTPKKRKIAWISGAAVLFFILILALILLNVKHYTPLYSNLSANEAGQIKDTLDSKKVPYQLSNGGTTISVPKDQVDNLKVELAAEGIPKTGEIDYSTFNQNSGFGMTDKQFDVLQRAAMQTELANLISNSKGVKSAKVMITLPQSDVWVANQKNQNKASASIVLNVDPGYQLTDEQVRGLYRLVAKSVPNLPENNIVIMDQYFNYYDLKNSSSGGSSTLSAYKQQQEVVNDVESNVQRRVTQMLTTMMGQGKVMVNVTADVDFTKTKEDQHLVEPVNTQTMQGLQSSTEHIAETYSGQGAAGQAGTGTNDVANYQANGSNGNGSYQKVEDKVNYVFNKIHREVAESPYHVTDLGIQVMIEPPNPRRTSSLSPQRINDVRQILGSIVKTSIDNGQGQELNQNAVDQKVYVSVGRFNGNLSAQPIQSHNYWLYIIGAGIAAAVLGFALWFFLRRRRIAEQQEEATVQDIPAAVEGEEADDLTKERPEQKKYNELERLAKQKPDEFVKLLRSWMSDDR